MGYYDVGANNLHSMRLIKVDKVHKSKVKMTSIYNTKICIYYIYYI